MDNINNFFCEIEDHFGWELDNESYVDDKIISIKLSYSIKYSKNKKIDYHTENEGNYLILKSDDFNLNLLNQRINSLIKNEKKIVKFSSINGKIANIEIKIKHNKNFDFCIADHIEFIKKQFSNKPSFFYYKNNLLEFLINTTCCQLTSEKPELSFYEYNQEIESYVIPENKTFEVQNFLTHNNFIITNLNYINNSINNILVYLKK